MIIQVLRRFKRRLRPLCGLPRTAEGAGFSAFAKWISVLGPGMEAQQGRRGRAAGVGLARRRRRVGGVRGPGLVVGMTRDAPARARMRRRVAVARAISVAACGPASLSVWLRLPPSVVRARVMRRILTWLRVPSGRRGCPTIARLRRTRPLTLPMPASALREHGLRNRIRIRLEAGDHLPRD
jgi:hypothetical protein